MGDAVRKQITPVQMLLQAHWLGVLMAVVGIVPGLNQLYSGHGGPAWFVLPFAFPWAICTYGITYLLAKPEERPVLRGTMKRALLAYAMFTLSSSFVASLSIETAYGLQLPPLQLWGMFFFPLNLPALLSAGVFD